MLCAEKKSNAAQQPEDEPYRPASTKLTHRQHKTNLNNMVILNINNMVDRKQAGGSVRRE